MIARSLRFCLVLGLAGTLAGCGGRETPTAATGPRQVRIDWLGNQSFKISSSIGTSILTDPYVSGTNGRSLPSPLKPDIVLVSHERSDANNIDAVDNQPAIFRGSVAMGINNSSGIRIRGVPTFRDPGQQAVEGMNIVFAWTMDGMRFCFLGSLVGPLTPDQISEIGTVDVLFVPVGGSLSPESRETVLAQLRPRLVIPMGRGAGGWTTGRIHSVPGRSVSLSRDILPLQTMTILFGS